MHLLYYVLLKYRTWDYSKRLGQSVIKLIISIYSNWFNSTDASFLSSSWLWSVPRDFYLSLNVVSYVPLILTYCDEFRMKKVRSHNLYHILKLIVIVIHYFCIKIQKIILILHILVTILIKDPWISQLLLLCFEPYRRNTVNVWVWRIINSFT